jgi:hypothetical protein
MACFGAGLRLVGKEAKMSPNSAIPRLLFGVLACMACTSPLVAAEQEGVHVCIGADHVVRHALRAPCGSGETSYLLAEEKGDIQSPDEEKGADKEMRELEQQVKALTARISELERVNHNLAKSSEAANHRVSAPFEVLDEAGNAILRVTSNDLREESPKDANILIGRAPGGNYWMRMRSEDGAEALDLAMTKAGQGFVQAYDPTAGKARSLFGWRGVSLFWSDDKESAALQIGDGGGGKLALAKAGMLMMEAGSTAEGRGVVRVGPNFTCTGTRLASGMGAPDCIMGRLGGSIK